MSANYQKLNPEPDRTNKKRYGIAFLVSICFIGLFLTYYNPNQIIGKSFLLNFEIAAIIFTFSLGEPNLSVCNR